MKKSILISTFLLMLALAAYSQNAYVCQPDTILLLHDRSIIDEGDSMFLFNTYDTEGFFIQCKEHYEDDGMKGERNRNIPSIQIKTEYEYDLNHNISKMRKRWYSGPRPGMYESHYTYQDDKLLLYTRYYIDFMGDSSIEDSVLYFYDDLGRIQKEITYDFLSQYSKHANSTNADDCRQLGRLGHAEQRDKDLWRRQHIDKHYIRAVWQTNYFRDLFV